MGQYGMTNYYSQKLQEGYEYQDFISDRLRCEGINIGVYSSRKYQLERGESAIGIEVKLDKNFRRTGNLYIEVAEKSNENLKQYTDSGIFREDNAWGYLIGDYQEAFLLSTKQLRAVYKNFNIKRVETPTSRGMLLPISFMNSQNLCIKHFVFNFNNKANNAEVKHEREQYNCN